MFYHIYPEVPARFGDNTVMNTSCHPPIVSKLHLIFDGWLGDEILETFPCFFVTNDLANSLKENKLSGFSLDTMETEVSFEFKQLYQDKQLSEFLWLKIDGTAKEDDFGIDDKKLVISEKALSVLKKHQFEYCDIEQV
tara:strand:- start:979 stop:1392 length:414 start_codon:yes stop_codon:yes gene_type:complete